MGWGAESQVGLRSGLQRSWGIHTMPLPPPTPFPKCLGREALTSYSPGMGIFPQDHGIPVASDLCRGFATPGEEGRWGFSGLALGDPSFPRTRDCLQHQAGHSGG